MAENLSSDAARAVALAEHIINKESSEKITVKLPRHIALNVFTSLLALGAADGVRRILEGGQIGEMDDNGLPLSEDIVPVLVSRLSPLVNRKQTEDPVKADLSFRELDSLGRRFLELEGTVQITGAYLFLSLNEVFVEAGGKDNEELRVKFAELWEGAVK